jgi:Tfp pilus assembly protein FimV
VKLVVQDRFVNVNVAIVETGIDLDDAELNSSAARAAPRAASSTTATARSSPAPSAGSTTKAGSPAWPSAFASGRCAPSTMPAWRRLASSRVTDALRTLATRDRRIVPLA